MFLWNLPLLLVSRRSYCTSSLIKFHCLINFTAEVNSSALNLVMVYSLVYWWPIIYFFFRSEKLSLVPRTILGSNFAWAKWDSQRIFWKVEKWSNLWWRSGYCTRPAFFPFHRLLTFTTHKKSSLWGSLLALARPVGLRISWDLFSLGSHVPSIFSHRLQQ